jgi:hypothetical protein
MTNPFKTETVVLRAPLKLGDHEVVRLMIRPPKFGDLIRTDKYPHLSHSADRALLSALTGEPEEVLNELVPEDWADCRVVLERAYKRFWGEIDLFEKQGAEENPTKAGAPPANSGNGSGTLPENC